jgi:hypothetical protein
VARRERLNPPFGPTVKKVEQPCISIKLDEISTGTYCNYQHHTWSHRTYECFGVIDSYTSRSLGDSEITISLNMHTVSLTSSANTATFIQKYEST